MVNWCEILLIIGPHQVVPGQELIGGEDSVQVLARYAHKLRKTGTRSDENCRKTFRIQKRIHSHCPSGNHIGFNLHSKSLHRGNLGGYNLLFREPELRNTVLKHAAGLVQSLENRHIVAHLGKVTGTGKSCRTASDDSHFVTVGRSTLNLHAALCKTGVGNEALQFADGNRFSLDAEDATALTLGLLRADTSTYGWKG